MAIDVNGADTYFSSRTSGDDWAAYSAEQRKAAIEQAKRDFSRALGRAMDEDEAQYRYGDRTRDEYAVYEQALYTLLRDAVQKGASLSPVPSLNPDEAEEPRKVHSTGFGKWSAEALAWLGASVRTEIVKG